MSSRSIVRQQGPKFGRLTPAARSEHAVARAPSCHQQKGRQ